MSSKAYPTDWAQNDAVRAAAQRWQRRGLLTPPQLAAIEAAHPATYYHPAFFLRVGLFLVTLLAIASFILFMGVSIGSHISTGGIAACSLVAAAALLALLEMTIHSSSHYRSGVDNALLYSALLAIAMVIALVFFEIIPDHYHPHSFAHPGLGLPLALGLAVLLLALLRYADPVVAVVAFGTALALFANLLLEVLKLNFWLLPPLVLLAAVGLHIGLRKLSARPDYAYYRSSLLVLRTLALATIYFSGNFLVIVSSLNALQSSRTASSSAPLAAVFYVFMFVVPVVYIVLSLRRHDRLLLLLGLGLLAFSLYTVRYFYHVLPPEVAATLGGAVLIVLALWALRYLRTPRHGLTAAADAAAEPRFNLEAVLAAQTAHVPAAPEAGFQFGGGQSGGGGAEGAF